MKKYFIVISSILMLVISCKSILFEKTEDYILVQRNHVEHRSWKLVWEDNFSETELDSTKWTKIPPNKADWGKYMTSSNECYVLSDDKLNLKGIVNYKTENDPRPYLTGGVYTKGKFAFQYGKIEIRVKLKSAQGAWPAIWMLAEKNKYGAYPKNGEIDIMEHLNYDDIVYQTVHSYYTLEMNKNENQISHSTSKIDADEFNIFGLEWYPNKLVYTLNGKETFVYHKIKGENYLQWPFKQPFYILIDQQLGGKWVGKINPDDLPVQMIVDYVRVYQK